MNDKVMKENNTTGKIRMHVRILSYIMALLPIESAISGAISPVSLLVVCYLLLSCLDAFLNGRKVSACVKYIMAYFVYCSISLLWGMQIWRRYFITSFFQNMFIAFFAILDRYSKKELNHIRCCMAGGIVLAVAVAFVCRITSDQNRLIISIINPIDPNEYAMGICFCLAYLFSRIRETKHRLLTVLGIVCCGIVIFMTGSRGGMLTFFAVFVIWFIFYAKKYRIKAAVICGVAALFFCFVFIDKISGYMLQRLNVLESLKSDGGAGRFNIWMAGLESFSESNLAQQLFGNGYGLFAPTVNYKPLGHTEPYMAHNMWVDCLITGGIIGCIFLLTLFISAFRIAVKNHNSWGVLAIVAFIVSSFSIDAQLYKVFSIVIFVAIVFNSKSKLRKEKVEKSYKSNKRSAFAVQGVVI